MNTFTVISHLAGNPEAVAAEILTMSSVNYELGPWITMTAPPRWRAKPLADWPSGGSLFKSTLLFCGVVPIDRHNFGLQAAGKTGFREQSSSLLMRSWHHQRQLTGGQGGTTVRDDVRFETRIGLMGPLLAPVYRLVFHHRHQRLAKRYGRAGK
ncbi:MAG: hypothetical protein R3300_15095 [Candidatus Promineifilaceae bacterium]|nr:hypothetical protein [Candidatus Promineifilaceae bacterium]